MDLVTLLVYAVGITILVFFLLAVGSLALRYFESHKERADPLSWQYYPALSRYGLLLITLPILAFLIYAFFLPGQTDRNRLSILAVILMFAGILMLSLHFATHRVRNRKGMLQIRSLFRSIDLSADDIAQVTFSSHGFNVGYSVRLKDGRRVSIGTMGLNLGAFERVLRENVRGRM